MARIHARKKGKSGSYRPVKADLSFSTLNSKQAEKKIIELAKQGHKMSEIGLILRDTYAVPSVKRLVGKSISKILEENDLLSNIPEDLNNLVIKYNKVKKHLETNKRDIHNKRGLLLIESKIRRLAKYYKRTGKLDSSWNYN